MISGYLITSGRLRASLGGFLFRRALRILPGFWACLLITSFALAPIAAWVNHEPFDLARAASYVGKNASTVILQNGVGLRGLANTEITWNAPLWSLAYETGAYLSREHYSASPGSELPRQPLLWPLGWPAHSFR